MDAFSSLHYFFNFGYYKFWVFKYVFPFSSFHFDFFCRPFLLKLISHSPIVCCSNWMSQTDIIWDLIPKSTSSPLLITDDPNTLVSTRRYHWSMMSESLQDRTSSIPHNNLTFGVYFFCSIRTSYYWIIGLILPFNVN